MKVLAPVIAILLWFEAAAAQGGFPMCSSWDRWSVAAAASARDEADVLFLTVLDCYGDNWYVCRTVNDLYTEAWDHLAQVFNGAAADSAGDCLRCDISALLSVAASLVPQETELNRTGYSSSIGSAWRTIVTWVDVPRCPTGGGGTAGGGDADFRRYCHRRVGDPTCCARLGGAYCRSRGGDPGRRGTWQADNPG